MTQDDHLWNPAAAPDAEVEALERALSPLRFASRARPLTLPAPSRVRVRPIVLALAASLLVAVLGGAGFWRWRESWPAGRAWPVTLQTAERTRLALDRPLQLDAHTSAEVEIARIGAMEVAPGSALALSQTSAARHRVVLDRGDVRVRVWAPPGRFAIRTPAGEVIDLGCIFDLRVEASGETALHVVTGWVQLANVHGESLLPAGTKATMTRDARPAVPVYDDAAPEFVRAVRAFEGTVDEAARLGLAGEIARHARRRDVITLLVLAHQAPLSSKRPLLEAAAALRPPPSGIQVDQVLADGSRLWDWYNALDLPPVKSWWRNWRDAFSHARR
ncbi:MAG TPA: hypothetical protein VFV75_12055 [Candidatus Polarisedimenticolaceae bacterium]|nr:hypothetical protein [Candidatus Polarisedimenticolaceae bacterium]